MASKYAGKREFVEALVEQGLTKKEIAGKAEIPYGSISYFLKKWGLKVERHRNKYEHLRAEIESLASEGDSYYSVAAKLEIPVSTCYYLFQRWNIIRSSNGKHWEKKDAVEKLLLSDTPVTEICKALEISRGSIGFLLEKWGLAHLQLRRRGIAFSPEGRESVSEKAKARHEALRYMAGSSHPMHNLLKAREYLVSEEEVEIELSEYVEQDLTISKMAEKFQVVPKTITNWLRRFGLQQGLRKGERCSWYKGGWIKGRGPDWLTIRKEILERDGYECRECGLTQEQARAQGHALSVHHIVPWRETHDNSPGNLLTLCQSHHMQLEWQSGYWA